MRQARGEWLPSLTPDHRPIFVMASNSHQQVELELVHSQVCRDRICPNSLAVYWMEESLAVNSVARVESYWAASNIEAHNQLVRP